MTLRDQGPIYNVGYGVTTRELNIGDNSDISENANPESSPIVKALHGNPIARFLAVGAATMVGAAVAGKMVRSGGIKVGYKAQEGLASQFGDEWVTSKVRQVQQIRKEFDLLQGAHRSFAQGFEGKKGYEQASRLFVEGSDGKITTDRLDDRAGFYMTRQEMLDAGTNKRGAIAAESYIDAIQKRMVRQARRLPYELPAAYAIDRLISDKVIAGEDRGPENWSNPVDVLTNFVTESVKNVAFAFAPFEVGVGTASTGYKRFMAYGDDLANINPSVVGDAYMKKARHSVAFRNVLDEVGHDMTKILNDGVRVSAQSTGAISSAVTTAQLNRKTLVEYLHQTRNIYARNRNAGMNPAENLRKSMLNEDLANIGPGPLRGLGAGIRAGRTAFNDIGLQFKANERLVSVGPTRFKESFADEALGNTTYGKALEGYQSMRSGLNARTSVENLANSLNDLGRGGPESTNWYKSLFYRSQMNTEYRRLLRENIMDSQGFGRDGIDESFADQVINQVRVRTPRSGREEQLLSDRIQFDRKPNVSPNEGKAFIHDISRQLTQFSPSQRKFFENNIESIVQRSDASFQSKVTKQYLATNIKQRYNFFEDKIVPRLAENVVGKRKRSFNEFLDIDARGQEYLQRRAALVNGFTEADSASLNEVRSFLHGKGLKPDNGKLLRGYLTDKNVLRKPHQKDGFNLFGIRQMSVAEARNRGVIDASNMRGSLESGNSMSRELNVVARGLKSRGIGLDDALVPGLYSTRRGNVVDTNIISSAARKGAAFLSEQLQIPILNFNPLQAMGFPALRNIRERGAFQYIPAHGRQPFIGGQGDPLDDMYIWARTGNKPRGKVFALSTNERGNIGDRELKGTYRPLSAEAKNLASKNMRYAIGETGRAPSPDRTSPVANALERVGRQLGVRQQRLDRIRSGIGNVSRRLDISDDQPQSIFGYMSRMRNRKQDLNRASVVARRLMNESPDRLGNVPDDLVDNMQGMLAQVRRLGFGQGTLRGGNGVRGLANDLALREQMGLNVSGVSDNLIPRSLNNIIEDGYLQVDKISNPDQLKDALRLIDNVTGSTNKTVSAAREGLLGRYGDISDESYMGYISGQTKTETIFNRLDEAKQDIYRFLGIRASQAGGFSQLEMHNRLSKLHAERVITKAEYRESTAALLSIQADVIRYSASSSSGRESVKAVVRGLMEPANARLLEPVAEDVIGLGSGRLDPIRGLGRKIFGSAEASYEGAEFNPFGVQTVLVPTLSTAMERNARTALGSVFQVNNWSNPSAFSGASLPGAHLFERINRYTGALGLGLDPTQYKGGLDFYARGLVGKRAFPIFAGGAVLLTADRTLGGFVNERDQYGDPVYAPYVGTKIARGVAEAHSLAAGLIPGGLSYNEQKEQLLEGEVPIRAGRFWPLGNTPFRGEGVQYFRPSYYRRMASGYSYTDQSGFDSPLEKLAFGYDFSPLRPLDPYRFERQTAEERPYPVSGEYFTGPWGPLTPALNMTIGRVLKPRRMMNEAATAQTLTSFMPAGDQGAYLPEGFEYGIDGGGGGNFGPGTNLLGLGQSAGGLVGSIATGGPGGGLGFSSDRAPADAGTYLAAGGSLGIGSTMAANQIGKINSRYQEAAFGQFGSPRLLQNATPMTDRNTSYQLGELGYNLQEMFGIYGFAFGSMREGLGLGDSDFTPNNPMLESASGAYGVGRSFWDLNLGGLGDVNVPSESPLGSIEFSEVVRRFIPRERSGIQTINGIPNRMGQEHSWLPGSDYFTNFKVGDPYTAVSEGEMRLPGQAYERFHDVRRDSFGGYSMLDQHRILGDVAPWSEQYRMVDNMVDKYADDPAAREDIETTRMQVGQMAQKNEFTDYKYKYSTPWDVGLSPMAFGVGRMAERVAHQDTILNTKFLQHRTATEDWEREYVYGRTFPQWQNPIEDFIEPAIQKSTQRSPIHAAAYMGAIGGLFGRSAPARMFTSFVGGAAGFGAAAFGQGYEAVTGDRYMPEQYKERMAIEEYSDILTYVKYQRLEDQAREAGDPSAAQSYSQLAGRTMYGVNLNTFDPASFVAAVPKQKREHFEAMLQAPEQERDRILSTAPRLERRMLQAAWGMPIEERPDLNEYFEDRELPDAEWEGWDPRVGQDMIKIKIAQSLGADLSEMGYYPQQIREANLLNPAYPNFNQGTNRSVIGDIMRSVFQRGGNASVTKSYTPFSSDRLYVNEGVGV